MIMFHITSEGETCQNGFNFYPWRSSQIGVRLKLRTCFLGLRYSRIVKRIFWTAGERTRSFRLR
jgi:hypothetical protein